VDTVPRDYVRLMLSEPDDLSDDDVLEAVRRHWRHPLERCEYHAAGMGAHHWLGYAEDDEPVVFVTADRVEDVRDPYLAARDLRDRGLTFVLAPERTVGGDVLAAVTGDWWLSTTPWVPGRSGDGSYRNDVERLQVAHLLGTLHSTEPPGQLPRWAPKQEWPDALAALDDLAHPWTSGPYAEPMRALFGIHEESIRGLMREFRELCQEVLPGDEPWVVTHGEPHTANVRWADDGRLLLLDWDTVAQGPRERDLGGVLAQATVAAPAEAYLRGGGSTVPPRRPILELFAREWVLDELDVYGKQLRDPHTGNENDRVAIESLKRYLDAVPVR
jgi:spectinomycin phosphotransferase